MLQRHVVGDSHDLAVLRSYKTFMLAGGWAAREAYRQSVAKTREVEHSDRREKQGPRATLPKDDIAARRKQWTEERSRRVADLSRLPPEEPPADRVRQCDETPEGDNEALKVSLNKSLLRAWLAANIPLNALDGMYDWLRLHVTHGHLLHHRSWLGQKYMPVVQQEQNGNIKAALAAARFERALHSAGWVDGC